MKILNRILKIMKGSDDMQYETIILELMTRIKKLEEEVVALKVNVEKLNTAHNRTQDPVWEERQGYETNQQSISYGKTTDQMIDVCYTYGKEAYEKRGVNLWELADKVNASTGMNRNSAFMYICAVKSMFEGTIYKRAINAKAQRKYFQNIYQEYGKPGLAKAIHAARLHAEYRKQCNIPADAVEDICRDFQDKLR